MANLSISIDHLSNPFPSLYSSTLLSTFYYYLHHYWEKEEDPRVRHLPLMTGGPTQMFVILGSYLFIVKSIGPKLMKNREPFQLRHQMLIYNIIMVLVNGYFFCEALLCLGFGADLAIFLKPNFNDLSTKQMRILYSGYLYWLTKFIDLLDTVFFVLRKKESQITSLHLYHHTIVPILGWFSIKLIPTAPPLGVFVIFNSFIHVIMYTYYALSSLGPQICSHKYLWWKRYLTQIQLLQFGIYGLYGCIFLWCQSGYPSWLSYCGVIQAPIFMYLFSEFYRSSYNKKVKRTEDNYNETKSHFNNNIVDNYNKTSLHLRKCMTGSYFYSI